MMALMQSCWRLNLVLQVTVLMAHMFEEFECIEELAEAKLQRALFKNYVPVRPVQRWSDTVRVRVNFHLLHVINLDTADQKMTVVGSMALTWKDYQLTWNPQDYGNITHTYTSVAGIWKPSFEIINSAVQQERVEEDPTLLIKIHHDGEVRWAFAKTFKTYCEVIVSHFPFDTQTCFISLTNWLSTSAETYFFSQMDNVGLRVSSMVSNTEWKIIRSDVASQEYESVNKCNVTNVRFSLTLRRQSGYYVITIILPLVILGFVDVMVFPLPPDSGEKVSLCVACLMAFFLMQVAIVQSLPNSWYNMPIIMVFNIALMVQHVLVVSATVFVLNIHLTDPDAKPPVWARLVSTKYRWKLQNNYDTRQQKKPDPVDVIVNRQLAHPPPHPLQAPPAPTEERIEMGSHKNGHEKMWLIFPVILEDIRKIVRRIECEEHEKSAEEDWKNLAKAVNTFFSYLFSLYFVLVMVVCGVMWWATWVYD